MTTVGSLIHPCYSIQSLFILSQDSDEMVAQDVQYVISGERVVRQQPLTFSRPVESNAAREETKQEDDEILRQL